MVSPTHMALRLIPLLLLLLTLFASSQKSTAVSASPIGEGWGGMSSLYETTSPTKCNTKNGDLIGDCIDDEEDEMESESSRRVLAQTRRRFVSYDALTKNKTPCNRRGHSYYNCARSGKANPYRRPCTIITRCKRILD